MAPRLTSRPNLLLCLAACLAANGALSAQTSPLLGPAPRADVSRRSLVQQAGGASAAYGDASYGLVVDPGQREQSRVLYRTVYAASEDIDSDWSGSVALNLPGTTAQAFKDATLRRINYFRAMAGVPAAIVFTDDYNALAQLAALMMSANAQLSHFPPATWLDYTADGATAAHNSNLALGTRGPDAVSGYIEDGGDNNAAVGHRRWVLCPPTLHMGTGDVDYTAGVGGAGTFYPANALWVIDPNGLPGYPATRDGFDAWPPKGSVPYQLIFNRWSFSYPDADFSAASVSMSSGGQPIPVQLAPVNNGYGENTLVWTPQGIDLSAYHSAAGVPVGQERTFHVVVGNVKVGGAATGFAYDVTAIDPQHPGPDTVYPTITGPDQPAAAGANAFHFAAVPGATGYQWEADTLSPLTLLLDAENGAGNVSVTPPGTNIITTAAHASGAASYQFTSYPAVSMMVNTTFVPAAGSSVRFNSRLGWATTDETAHVQISSDLGHSWQDLYSQTGTGGMGESAFTARTLDLSAYAGQPCRVRFVYTSAGSYFQPGPASGWFVDDIAVLGAQQMAMGPLGAVPAGGTDFSFTPPAAGSYALRVRPVFYGSYPEPGLDAVKYVNAIDGVGTAPAHPAFFAGEVALGGGAYYLQFPSGNPFGYYSYLADPHYVFHFDLGYEYVFDANDGKAGVYLYDFASNGFFYTSPTFPFPYLYDFSLGSTVYYYPDPSHPGRYNTGGTRYFFVFNTGKIISK